MNHVVNVRDNKLMTMLLMRLKIILWVVNKTAVNDKNGDDHDT